MCRAAKVFFACITLVHGYNNGMGRTPPMGWNSWCTGGGTFDPSLCNLLGRDPCSEEEVKSTADAIVNQGMDKLGYKYIALDDCWSTKTRDAHGRLQWEADKFPSGMKALADYVHSKGLLFGLYTSVGDKTCKGDRPGSYGHYQIDAETLTGWGVDMIKMDHCGGKNGTDPELYGEMSKALNATGRPVLFSLCSWGEDKVWEWGHKIAQMYRVQMDHLPFWHFPAKSAGQGYGEGVADIIEWMAMLKPSNWTKEYGWMDPDFLMTRYPTMDMVSSTTEYSFWSLWSAPLMSPPLPIPPPCIDTVHYHWEVIAINQDGSNTAGDRIAKGPQGQQTWARRLLNGDKAVILYNTGESKKSQTVGVSWAELGWPTDAKVQVRDLWARASLGAFTEGFNRTVPPRSVAMLRLQRAT